MKNHIKYIILLFLVVGCSTTKNIQIGLVKFKLPKYLEKIDAKDLNTTNKLNQKIIDAKNIYKIDNIYVTTSDTYKGEVKKNLLEGYKKGFDYQMKDFGLVESNQYKSSLTKINNNDVFTMYTFYKNVGEYTFKMINKDYNQIISGRVVFENQSNYEEATKILNDFLKSVKFE
jgi:hypothetical protein